MQEYCFFLSIKHLHVQSPRRQKRRFAVFIVNFEHTSNLLPVLFFAEFKGTIMQI